MEMLTAKIVAEYFLALTDEASGEGISNLKLQKLVYYAQGVHLALTGEPLFPEPIHAWMHGPVVPPLYAEYKDCGRDPIPVPTGVDFDQYGEHERETLDVVNTELGQYSAWRLREMTHDEPPWRDAYQRGSGTVISVESMHTYFKTLVVDD